MAFKSGPAGHGGSADESGKGTMENYFGFLVLLLFAAGTAGGILALASLLGPKHRSPIHDMPFECGKPPVRILRGNFSIKFFMAALLFILFDVELIFLFPWAVVYRELGIFGFVEMLIFLLVVVAGLIYSIKRGVLEWK
jgi:NADH-quinone oxidoreductase subunit A